MIEWVADKPDMTVGTWEEMPKGFTGIIRVEASQGIFYLINGREDRDMGPSAIYDDGNYLYCLGTEFLVSRKTYWKTMLEKFPEREAEVLTFVLNESFDKEY